MKTPTEQTEQTFVADFGNGITCRTTLGPDNFKRKLHKPPVFEWSGRPTKETLPAYQAWVHSIHQQIVDRALVKTMHVFMLPGGLIEIWLYQPNNPPECVERIQTK